MERLFTILWITLFINSYLLHSQDIHTVDKWMEYIEEQAEETDDAEQVAALYAELSYLSEHPFNLNTATGEQLEKLPFLSAEQIDALLRYRRRHGEMATVYELKGIKEINRQTIELLLPFIYVSAGKNEDKSLTINNLLKYGKNELVLRYDQCLQRKKGYQQVPDSLLTVSPNKKYIGEPFSHSLRYSLAFSESAYAGIVAEKDAGEPFFRSLQPARKGYDFYSAHVLIKPETGWLKTLAAGDYKASFGQGLVFSQDFTPGRTALVTQVQRRNNGFRRHYSTNENDFLRGAAATLSFHSTEISLFYSRRKLDGIVEENEIRSFKTDGLHRLVRDLEKEKQITMQTAGGNIRYAVPAFCIGVTAVYYTFNNLSVFPESKPYNIFYFRGKRNVDTGVDYLLKVKNFHFFGETALSANKGVAALHGVRFVPASYISLLLLYRSYSKKYQAYFGRAFAQYSEVQNETGVYIAAELAPFARWKVAMYADLYRFPWLKYGIDFPSSGKEYMCRAEYTCSGSSALSLRYRYRDKETGYQKKIRGQFAYSHTCWMGRTSFDWVLNGNRKTGRTSAGWMAAQSAGCKLPVFPLQITMYAAYFHTAGYESRIASYEKNILYAFSMPSCYGEGIRLALSFKIEAVKNGSFSAKIAGTKYFDRDKIGSGLEEITGSIKIDLYTAIQLKF